MERNVDVSVIVPIYNAEPTIARCLDSLVAQTFIDNTEIILVDDGSTDRTPEIIDDYAGKYPQIRVIHQENKGVSAARNAGISLAEGEWIAFCDSDDTAVPRWLEAMYEETPNADLVVCGYNIYRMDLSDNPVPRKESVTRRTVFMEPDIILETLLKERQLQFIWNKLFRKSVIDAHNIRFDESFTVFEDEDFVLEYISWIADVVAIPEAGYNYYFPADFYEKYEFSINDFKKVIKKIYFIIAGVPGRVKLPSIVYWYKIALSRYASRHTYEQTKDSIRYGRKIASSFHRGPFNYLLLRILPSKCIYHLVRRNVR